jgi:hypothetical protein
MSAKYTSKECKSCHLLINDGQAYKLGTEQWHVSCFKCSKCSKSLGVDSNFLVLGTGALVCSDCSYTCKSCDKKIYDLAILTGDLAYCADCFKCKSCNKPIDDLKYARTSKGLFCMPCHNMLMEKKKKYEKMKKLKAAKEKSILDKKKNLKLEEKEQKNNDPSLEENKYENNNVADLSISFSKPIANDVTMSEKTYIEPPKIKSKDRSSSINSKQLSYNATSSSASTFDLDDYVDNPGTKDEEITSSVYTKSDDLSIQDSNRINSSVEVIESTQSNPIKKLAVVLDHDVTSPGTAKIQQTPTFEDYKLNPIPIPNLPSNSNNNGFSYLSSEHEDNSDPDIVIPLRSPRRSALSPVRNTAQFRTPELDTPKKKPLSANLMSPSSAYRQAHIFDDTETEREPESFINLDETEEESIVSKESEYETQKDGILLSPIKYNSNSFDSPGKNVGLNIKGLGVQELDNSNNQVLNKQTSLTKSPLDISNTPEQNSQSSFEVSDRATPNSKKKQIGGLGRSLTKVFGRNRKLSNEFQSQQTQNTNDYPPTPETLTSSRKSSTATANNIISTPKKHVRTQSDHSFVAFTTPPVPQVGHHTRSISESTTLEPTDQVLQTQKELKVLKTEINSLTLTKATILRDIQNLRTQLKLLELDISEKQKVSKNLDSIIQVKQKLVSTDELSTSNNSSTSLRNSSKEELLNTKIASSESVVYEESPNKKAVEITVSQPNTTPPTTASSTTSILSTNLPTYNPYHQSNLSSSQSKDKRSGFMRRIFGTHSTLNSAGSGQTNNNSISVANSISQPMNVRHNEDNFNFNELSNKPPTNQQNDNQASFNSGIKSSRSANFMQWKISGNNNSSGSNNKSTSLINSSENLLYNMSLQELANSEGSATGVPFIVKTCILEIERRGLKIEGIYRISASTSTVEKLEQLFESLDINNTNDINKMRSIIDNGDIHAMAGLLKRYLKKIPDSLIPQELYNSYININNIQNEEERIDRLSKLILSLPETNKSTLLMLTKHLALVAENEKFNKMNSTSLATVFAPTLVRLNTLHPTQEIQDNKSKTAVTELVFKKYSVIFK